MLDSDINQLKIVRITFLLSLFPVFFIITYIPFFIGVIGLFSFLVLVVVYYLAK